jgi:ectoine hydroxylase-related dioxygenase (phytanoyl-CoA dioxygenase family)
MTDRPDQITVSVQAGDAAVLDYRLLHGTHANDTPDRRDCLLLSFIPDWCGLPSELKAHLIVHPALPGEGEGSSHLVNGYADLLPRFAGTSTTLAVNRLPPTIFSAQ